jgi:hypothetical protein
VAAAAWIPLAAFSNRPPRPNLPNEIGVHYQEENSRIMRLITTMHVLSRLRTRGTAHADLHDVVHGADLS